MIPKKLSLRRSTPHLAADHREHPARRTLWQLHLGCRGDDSRRAISAARADAYRAHSRGGDVCSHGSRRAAMATEQAGLDPLAGFFAIPEERKPNGRPRCNGKTNIQHVIHIASGIYDESACLKNKYPYCRQYDGEMLNKYKKTRDARTRRSQATRSPSGQPYGRCREADYDAKPDVYKRAVKVLGAHWLHPHSFLACDGK